MTIRYPGYNIYRGGAYFICDICGQRHRRTQMLVEWDNLRVDKKCWSPPPPQLTPPNVFPEGLPFLDSRPPQDYPDRLQDDTTLHPIVGGIAATVGLIWHPANGQDLGPGAISPQDFIETVQIEAELGTGTGSVIGGGGGTIIGVTTTGVPQGPGVIEDDITFITGRVYAKP